MASEAWPVCCLILNVETPARVALVAKPARRLWPEYPVGSNPATTTRSRRIKDTASPESRLAETCWCLRPAQPRQGTILVCSGEPAITQSPEALTALESSPGDYSLRLPLAGLRCCMPLPNASRFLKATFEQATRGLYA
jgi:hypothetical protein